MVGWFFCLGSPPAPNCLGFLPGGFDSYPVCAGNDVNSVRDRRPKMLSGTSQASLAAKTNCKPTLKVPFYKSKKIHCSAGLRPIVSKYFVSQICA